MGQPETNIRFMLSRNLTEIFLGFDSSGRCIENPIKLSDVEIEQFRTGRNTIYFDGLKYYNVKDYAIYVPGIGPQRYVLYRKDIEYLKT